jgi:CHRD domain/PEP-CTERM motif
MDIEASFTGLGAPTTVAHIHCCTAAPESGNVGVATTTPTFPGFPAGVTSGNYSMTFDLLAMSTYNIAFINGLGGGTVAGAEAALLTGLDGGLAYFNVHTTAFPAGEIRGFLQVVPEPTTVALLGAGLLGLAAFSRRHTIR